MGQRKHGVSEKTLKTTVQQKIKEVKRWVADAFKYHLPLELESSGGRTCQEYKYVIKLLGDVKGLVSQVTCILHSQISRTSRKAFLYVLQTSCAAWMNDESNEMQAHIKMHHLLSFPQCAFCQPQFGHMPG